MNNILSNIWYLFQWLTFRRKIQFFLIVFFSVFVSLMEMVAIGSIVPFISTLLDSKSVFGNNFIFYLERTFQITEKNNLIMVLGTIFVVFSLITGICRSVLIYVISYYSNVVLAEIGKAIYSQKLNEPFIEFISKSSDEIISLISAKLLQIYGVICAFLLLLTSLILFISIISILLFIDLKLTLISIFVFGFLYVVIILSSRNTLLRNSKIISQNQTLMVKSLQEGVGSIRDIILDGNQKIHVNSFSKLIFERGFKVAINDFIAQSPRFILETLGIILISIYLFLFSDTESGVIGLFPILSALALGAQRIMPLMNLIYTNYTTAIANSHQLNEAILVLKNKKKYYESKIDKKFLFNNKISLDDISFRYRDNLSNILENIDFQITKGSKIGILGKTGVGKSTLLDIIMGLLIPTSGKIYIDEKLITPENITFWRKKVTHVPQDIFLINGSILENIAFGIKNTEIDKDKAEECAKKSEIFNFIQSLPNKLNETVGERGIKLSGGQKQRIGIARALYRGCELIVLDEATNALDTRTEKKIIDSISKFENVTIIMVAHRIDTLKICDKVYKVENNKITETII